MLRRGDILVERLTGKRAMVIDVPNTDQVTCRFGDGRLEDRFTFEIDPAPRSLLDTIASYIKTMFALGASKDTSAQAKPAAGRPRLARNSRS